MNDLFNLIPRVSKLSPEFQTNVLLSVLIILFLWIFRVIAQRVVFRRTEDVRARYRWGKTLTYISVVFGVLLVGRIWFKGIQSLATFLGLLSAGLAIALKDLVADIAGWLFILWRRPLEVGNRIQLGDTAGDVIDIGVFQFTVLEIGNWVHADQSTGRMIQIPNFKVFTEPLANYSKGFEYIWNEIPVLVTFESDWKKAKKILQEIADRHFASIDKAVERQIKEASKRFMIFYSALTPTVYTSVVDFGVLLTIRYICEPRRRRGTTQAIWEDTLDAFAKCDDIDFAYPTRRVFDNLTEGKPGTRPTQVPQAGEQSSK
ncbi:MAG: mechanosensitive ion channel family protein [Candidatus Abyssobacteria bacterium SURF_17]|uniref:Mechanosensitive ion channel family protein n=1 Tax=Candidatus Abyssobacteria bacterium SURF_17 TaxID=2093361 RepID=A0A419EVI1_9BACT|nr:MAG: mechanosensitive ion channel family protein [Candidatus Abyssubacteria bacterium SURF_17]